MKKRQALIFIVSIVLLMSVSLVSASIFSDAYDWVKNLFGKKEVLGGPVLYTCTSGTFVPSCLGAAQSACSSNFVCYDPGDTNGDGVQACSYCIWSAAVGCWAGGDICSETSSSHTLSVSKIGTGSGTVTSNDGKINCGVTCSGVYNSGDSVTLTATPAPGYGVSWTGCDSGGGASLTCLVTMNSDKSVGASFSVSSTIHYTSIDYDTGNLGSGSFKDNKLGNTYSIPALNWALNDGTIKILTAIPNPGFGFVSWRGCDSVSGANNINCTIYLDSSKNIYLYAKFRALPDKNLTLNVNPSGKASLPLRNPAGTLVSGTTNKFSYPVNQQVRLTGNIPAQDCLFSKWIVQQTGGGTATCQEGLISNSCTIIMDADKNITANYTCYLKYNLVISNPFSNGTVKSTSTPTQTSQINCGQGNNICSVSYSAGANVTLTVTAATGYNFTGWNIVDSAGIKTTDNCATSKTCKILMDKPKFVIANFESLLSLRTFVSSGQGTTNPTGIKWYKKGTVVKITATPASGYYVYGFGSSNLQCTPAWPDSIGNVYYCNVTLTVSGEIGVVFKLKNNLSVTKSGIGNGIVTSVPSGINCRAACSALYKQYVVVNLTATAAANSTFTGWTGCDKISGTKCSVNMTADKKVNANFDLKSFNNAKCLYIKIFNSSGDEVDKLILEKEYNISVRFNNTGTTTWSSPNYTMQHNITSLGVFENKNMPGIIEPKNVADFNFKYSPQGKIGNRNLIARMMNVSLTGKTSLFGTSCTKAITIACNDADGDGYNSTAASVCGSLDCQDDPASGPDFCRQNDIDCSNIIFAECSKCIHPNASKSCGVDADCSGVVYNRDANGDCKADEQCVLYGASTSVHREKLEGDNDQYSESYCTYMPGSVSGDANCNINYRIVDGSNQIIQDWKDVSCLKNNIEGMLRNNKYGELDFDYFSIDSACVNIIFKPNSVFHFNTKCVKKDTCLDGVDNDLPKDLFQVPYISPYLKKSQMQVKNSAGEIVDIGSFSGKFEIKLKDVEENACHKPLYCNDQDKDGFCENSILFPDCQDDPSKDLDANSGNWIFNERSFPASECSSFENGAPVDSCCLKLNQLYPGKYQWSSSRQNNPRSCLIFAQRKSTFNQETGQTELISAGFVHPFQTKISCNLYKDVNCNKGGLEGYNLQSLKSGGTPFDKDLVTGVESGTDTVVPDMLCEHLQVDYTYQRDAVRLALGVFATTSILFPPAVPYAFLAYASFEAANTGQQLGTTASLVYNSKVNGQPAFAYVTNSQKTDLLDAGVNLGFAFMGASQSLKLKPSAAEELAAAQSPCKFVPKTEGSFLAGTKILMEDGSYKNIEDIKLGERVIAYDVENNVAGNATITHTFFYNTTKYRVIEYEIIK